MKKQILYILIGLAFRSFANQDCVWNINNNKTHMAWTASCELHQFETKQKGEILLELINSLLKEKKYTSEHIFIHYSNYFFRDNNVYTKVSYGEANYTVYDNKTSKNYTANGIKIYIHNFDIDIKKTLILIDNYVDSVNKVKPDSNLVNKIIRQRIYRNKTQISETNTLDYYFENGKFQFYYLFEPGNNAKPVQKNLLSTNNVFEIVGQKQYEGYLVFINDSTFYYLHSNTCSKALLFNWHIQNDTIFHNRSPIKKYNIEYYDDKDYSFLSKFFLYYNYDRKALFLPHQDFVVTDYAEREAQFIKSFTDKHFVSKSVDKPKSNEFYIIILLGLLTISIILNVIYIKKNQ